MPRPTQKMEKLTFFPERKTKTILTFVELKDGFFAKITLL